MQATRASTEAVRLTGYHRRA